MKNDDDTEQYHQEIDLSHLPQPSLTGHSWVQMGFQLICQSCSHQHGVMLKPGQMYQGNDDGGKPIIKKIW